MCDIKFNHVCVLTEDKCKMCYVLLDFINKIKKIHFWSDSIDIMMRALLRDVTKFNTNNRYDYFKDVVEFKILDIMPQICRDIKRFNRYFTTISEYSDIFDFRHDVIHYICRNKDIIITKEFINIIIKSKMLPQKKNVLYKQIIINSCIHDSINIFMYVYAILDHFHIQNLDGDDGSHDYYNNEDNDSDSDNDSDITIMKYVLKYKSILILKYMMSQVHFYGDKMADFLYDSVETYRDINVSRILVKNKPHISVILEQYNDLYIYKLYCEHNKDYDKDRYWELFVKQDPIYTFLSLTNRIPTNPIRKLNTLWRYVHKFL